MRGKEMEAEGKERVEEEKGERREEGGKRGKRERWIMLYINILSLTSYLIIFGR